jgi:hypothetical protein
LLVQINAIILQWVKETFQIIEEMKQADVIGDYAYLPFDETLNVRVLRPEYLAAEALKVGRPKDVGRISALLETEEFDLDRFSDLVERFSLQEKWAKIQPFLIQE